MEPFFLTFATQSLKLSKKGKNNVPFQKAIYHNITALETFSEYLKCNISCQTSIIVLAPRLKSAKKFEPDVFCIKNWGKGEYNRAKS